MVVEKPEFRAKNPSNKSFEIRDILLFNGFLIDYNYWMLK